MAPGASSPAPPRFVAAQTPVEEVRVSLSGLQGRARAAAHAAAEAAQSARTLGGLDEQLRGGAVAGLAAAAAEGGAGLAVEVSPGPRRGVVGVTFRAVPPPTGAHWLAACVGSDDKLDSAVNLRWEHAAPATDGGDPVRLCLGGLFSLGRDAGLASLRMAPPAAVRGVLAPAVEIGVGGSNLTEWLGPRQRSVLGAGTLSLEDTTGKHAIRFQAVARDLLPGRGIRSDSPRRPMRSVKTSVGYRFLSDTREAAYVSPGELRAAVLEVAGQPGDVAMAKAEAMWMRTWRVLGGGLLSVAATGGAAVPLDAGGIVPLEERFFLGGTCGQGPGERLPGFAAHGTGPVYARHEDGAAVGAGPVSRARETLRSVIRFGRNWQVERHTEESPDIATESSQFPSVARLGGAARASLAATLLWPVPLLPGLHLFATGAVGSLVDEVRPSLPQDLLDEARASVAAGVAAALPGGVLVGCSLAQPVRLRQRDELQRFQLWLSFGRLL